MVKYSVKSLSTTKQSALVKVRAGQHKPSAGQVHAGQLRAQLYISNETASGKARRKSCRVDRADVTVCCYATPRKQKFVAKQHQRVR